MFLSPWSTTPGDAGAASGFAWLTVARLALIPPVIVSFMKVPAVTTACLGLFMVLDLADGALARAEGKDGVYRRSLDSTVDRIGIDACLIAAAVVGAMPVVLVIAFLARDLYCACLCVRMVAERGVVIKADIVYRALNFLMASWALSAPFVTAQARTTFGGLLLLASVLVAVDLTRATRRVRRAPIDVRNCVVPARTARRGFASQPQAITSGDRQVAAHVA
jgi:phosphatidylglycerophosphate synthase